ncbi:hypothetical protein ACLKA6_011324 [Drosophila palustris]
MQKPLVRVGRQKHRRIIKIGKELSLVQDYDYGVASKIRATLYGRQLSVARNLSVVIMALRRIYLLQLAPCTSRIFHGSKD